MTLNKMENDYQQGESTIKYIQVLVVIFVVVGLGAFIYGLRFYYISGKITLPDLGSYLSGTVGTIWSLAGLLLVYIAFLGQKKQLGIQKEELVLNRQEVSGQREQMVLQNKTLLLQKFENTFFQLVFLHHEIVRGIDSIVAGKIIQGRDVFQHRYETLKRSIDTFQYSNPHYQSGISLHVKKHMENYQADFGHYFRNLYYMIEHVDISDLSIEEKLRYTRLIRAQLTTFELLWLFYLCISDEYHYKFKKLIEDYHFFKHLPKKDLADPNSTLLYQETAYND